MTERMTPEQLRRAAKGTTDTTALPETAAKRTFRGKSNGRYGGKRHVPGQMNKTEESYAAELEMRRVAGEVLRWEFEAVTFKLAADCRLTPDFMVELANGEIEFVDTKGTGPIDPVSKVKMRLAADKFYEFRFAMLQRQTKKAGGGWDRVEF